MKTQLKNILIVSSADPSVAAGVVALDYYNALKKTGTKVDFLTKNKSVDYPDFFYVEENCAEKYLRKIITFIKKVSFKFFRIITRRDYKLLVQRYFFYKNERKPPVSNRKLLKALPKNKRYDLILIMFWQEMLSASSLEALYEKYKCPIFIGCVDYSPMTGGCHFISDCTTFEKGCGACEIWYSKNQKDFTYKNALEKKRIYEKIKPVLLVNRYMDENYASKSPILKNTKKEYIFPVINDDLFCPTDKKLAKKELNIDENKKVLFFACQNLNDTRKGGKYVIDALNIFYEGLSSQERDNILVILAGRAEKEIESVVKFNCKTFGYVDTKMLIKLYQAADIYLSGSVIDAGPMMVNQALSCGVPVVAFYIGTAIDVINGKNTGYIVKEFSANAFAQGINWWYSLSEEEYNEISDNCRKIAMKTTSYEACVKKINYLYECIKF